jgi:hypothetical protein
VLERLKALFGSRSEEPAPERPFEEAELPAGPLTGLTSPLDAGADRPTAEPVDDEHP